MKRFVIYWGSSFSVPIGEASPIAIGEEVKIINGDDIKAKLQFQARIIKQIERLVVGELLTLFDGNMYILRVK